MFIDEGFMNLHYLLSVASSLISFIKHSRFGSIGCITGVGRWFPQNSLADSFISSTSKTDRLDMTLAVVQT